MASTLTAASGAAAAASGAAGSALHIAVIGGGSAAFAAASAATSRGARVTMINGGLPLGGCCVNVGCVPSKALLRAGAAVHGAVSASTRFAGVESSGRVVDFGAVTAQAQDLVDELQTAKYVAVADRMPALTVLRGIATLVDSHTVSIDAGGGGGDISTLHPDRVIVATGSTTFVPDIPGLAGAGYLTHDAVFALKERPASAVILGGRYIALEMAQLLSRLGTNVTILQRSSQLLPTEDPDVGEAIRTYLAEEGITVHTGVETHEVVRGDDGVVDVDCTVAHPHASPTGDVATPAPGSRVRVRAAALVLATGRRPNTEHLVGSGIKLDDRGAVVVDGLLRTSLPDVFAAGDVLGGKMFVYTAAYEGDVAACNATAEEECCMAPVDYDPLPWVIFTDPQVAGVGYDERQAAAAGVDVDVSVCPLSAVPRALTARDTRGFIKLLRHKTNHRILGVRVVAAEGSELLMQVSTAIAAGMTSDAVAGMFHPYLTLGEGIKLAALGFDKDIATLSCCAT